MTYIYALLILGGLAGAFYVGRRYERWRPVVVGKLKDTVRGI